MHYVIDSSASSITVDSIVENPMCFYAVSLRGPVDPTTSTNVVPVPVPAPTAAPYPSPTAAPVAAERLTLYAYLSCDTHPCSMTATFENYDFSEATFSIIDLVGDYNSASEWTNIVVNGEDTGLNCGASSNSLQCGTPEICGQGYDLTRYEPSTSVTVTFVNEAEVHETLCNSVTVRLENVLTIVPETVGSTGAICFSGDSLLTLEDSTGKAFRDLAVGDVILSADRNGKVSPSPVVFLPHNKNNITRQFDQIETASGNVLTMTRNHLLPLCDGTLVTARSLEVGQCLRTVNGEGAVSKVTRDVTAGGVYTAVTANEFLVVNGVVASPFALANGVAYSFYDKKDVAAWCAGNAALLPETTATWPRKP